MEVHLTDNLLVAYYDIHGRKGEVLFFCFVSDTTRDPRTTHKYFKTDTTINIVLKKVYIINLWKIYLAVVSII
jgi:hypothetical protein